MEEKTGLSGLEKNAKGREQEKITFDDMVRQPRFIISSVTSTGKNDKKPSLLSIYNIYRR